MNQVVYPIMITSSGEKVELVFACAWCPKESYTPLQDGQVYSHGICEFHLSYQIKKLRQKYAKNRQPKKHYFQ